MSATNPQTDPVPEVLTIDKPEQLKALGHPLRLRVLETLGESDTPMSNRDLAQKLGVDPGHLHLHARMLLRAGLIEQVASAKGREKPYRAASRTSSAGGTPTRTRVSSGSCGSTCASRRRRLSRCSRSSCRPSTRSRTRPRKC